MENGGLQILIHIPTEVPNMMPAWAPRPAGRPPSASSGQLGRVGLVLGEYDIYSRDINDWPDLFREENSNLILTLAGSRHGEPTTLGCSEVSCIYWSCHTACRVTCYGFSGAPRKKRTRDELWTA